MCQVVIIPQLGFSQFVYEMSFPPEKLDISTDFSSTCTQKTSNLQQATDIEKPLSSKENSLRMYDPANYFIFFFHIFSVSMFISTEGYSSRL